MFNNGRWCTGSFKRLRVRAPCGLHMECAVGKLEWSGRRYVKKKKDYGVWVSGLG